MNVKGIIRNSLMLAILVLIGSSCSVKKMTVSNAVTDPVAVFQAQRAGGGSSGMEKIGDQSYLVVYDVKNFRAGYRMGLVKVNGEELVVEPMFIESWDSEGISSDLESICSIPGRPDEFLIAESGNWQGKLGRIFHIKVDVKMRKAKMLGSVKLPFQHKNDIGLTGDQFEAMACLDLDEHRRIVLLGERGGSGVNPRGTVRWGELDLVNHRIKYSEAGMRGIEVDVPGNWMNPKSKRDITDFHIDDFGRIWAAASEDQGDSGPFYSVVYQLGKINPGDKSNPVMVFKEIETFEEIPGFKIEALSGPCDGIESSHTFGTEDEMYGGIWRPIVIAPR